MRISDAAFDLVVREEVTSKSHYEAELRRPEWPGGESGVTVGIGYDLGHTEAATIDRDWRGRVGEAMLVAMVSAQGVTGRPAKALAERLQASIDIPWDTAIAVHKEAVVPRWENKVARVLPNVDRLPPDCFGALVSLTFNRGASYDSNGDRYREMRAIKAHMAALAFDRIPDEIRSMKRLWVGQRLDGLLRRRDAEADLFARGLAQLGAVARPLERRPELPDLAAPGLVPRSPAEVAADLAVRVIAAMEAKKHTVDKGPGEINIVYVEGLNPDGTPNGDEANKWNDLRLLIRFEDDRPRIVGLWAATTEPGRYFTENPLNPGGAARIEFGQYRAWQVGMHRGNHEALVQTGGAVTVCRDLNKDFNRTGDRRDTGHFGINQHWGYDLPEVDKASAGCLVGRSKTGHREFMALVKTDPRFRRDEKFVFTTTVLPESDVLAVAVADRPRAPADIDPASDGRDEVRRIQRLLGFSEQGQDGIFGAITEDAVKRFQRRHGLTVTGDVDDDTMARLVAEATELAAPASPGAGLPQVGGPQVGLPQVGGPRILPEILSDIGKLGLGAGSMNPFVLLAAQILPGILQAVAGDKVGAVAQTVAKTVKDVTGKDTAEAAADRLKADPVAVAALQVKLAEIAAEQEEARQKAQIEVLKAQSENEAKKRESELQTLRAEIDNTKDARANLVALSQVQGADTWITRAAPNISYIVTGGFFAVLLVIVLFGIGPLKPGGGAPDNNAIQIVNIVLGALTAAFATVVNFWLGSSQGSRDKDATLQIQAGQSTQGTKEILKSQTEQTKAVLAMQAEETRTVLKAAITAERGRAPADVPQSSKFERCVNVVLAQGGRAPAGDAVRFGVDLAELKAARGDDTLTKDDLQTLTREQACEVYRTRYWNVLRCDDLPAGVDLVMFDFAVCASTAVAAKALQQEIGAEADGSVGPATLLAARSKRPKDIVRAISQRRLDYHRGRPDWATAGSAWTTRANAVADEAVKMVESTS